MPGDQVEEIKNKLDVKEVIGSYLKLEKRGANYRASCPFHNEKTPSFFVSPARQVWRCFGCSEGGDIFSFIQGIEGVDFPEALRILASQAGVQLQRQDPRIRSERNKSIEVCELAAKYFRHQLESKNGKLIIEYLGERGINQESIDSFRIGYAPNNSKSLISFLKERGYDIQDIEKAGLGFRAERTGEYLSRFRGRIMFPIFTVNGDIVAFGGRALTPELAIKLGREVPKDIAKYINSPKTNVYDKSNILYGLDKAKIAIRQEDACVVVEGYTDVILAHQTGYKNVVAASGTALTEQHLNLIKRFSDNLLTSFDMDIAGDSATRRGIDLAQLMGFNIKVVTLENGKDPADIIKEDEKIWVESLKNSKSVLQFYFDSAFSKHDSSSPEGKREIGKTLAPILKNIASSIEQSHWVNELASKLQVGEEAVWDDVKQIKDIPRKEVGGGMKKSPKISVPRKDLIAQQVLLHILKNPSLSTELKDGLYGIDEHDKVMLLIKTFSGVPKSGNFEKNIKNLKADDQTFVNQLLFEAEIRGDEEFSKESLEIHLSAYKKLSLDEELKELERKIRQNEKQNKKEDNKKLLEEFNEKLARRAEF